MIPKVIHYCWFGRNPKPEVIQKCIESWYKYLPDYEIKEWNEDNFDVNSIPYTRDAYAAKKWAFVSDYARLKIVYDNGGVYLDTDVLLHDNSIDQLSKYDCWLASEDVRYIATGLGFGGGKSNRVIGSLAINYEKRRFQGIANTFLDKKILEKELTGWYKSNRSQVLNGNIYIIGMNDYGKYARHISTLSWQEYAGGKTTEYIPLTWYKQRIWELKCLVRHPALINFFDKRQGCFAEKAYTFFAYDFLDYGVLYWLKRLVNKIF